MNVFVVQHVHEIDGVEEVFMIGVYSTPELAEEAVNRLKIKPGFVDCPDGFEISRYSLNQDNWIEGYRTFRGSEAGQESSINLPAWFTPE